MAQTGTEELEALIAQSSLGALGARMLRSRTDPRSQSDRRSHRQSAGPCLWRRRLLRLADRLVPVGPRLRGDNPRQPQPPRHRQPAGTASLTPIRPIGERLRAWHEVTGHEIGFINLDMATEYDRLAAVLLDIRPDAIVHFAAQRAAPYSMRSEQAKRYTVDNNVRGTHNLLVALTETGIDASLVHLGTMGVYGYEWPAPIPEGYLTLKVPTPVGDLERRSCIRPTPGRSTT